MNRITRRDAIALTSLGLSTLPLAASGESTTHGPASPAGSIQVRVTDAEHQFKEGKPLGWKSDKTAGSAILIDAAQPFQEILGFGAAFTDASAWTFSQMPEDAREKVMRELFAPDQAGLNVCRLCIGASDYSRSVFGYDEGQPDPDMTRFSIDHDREYILPVIKSALSIEPELFLFATPWSPPGWMKSNGSMLGGCMQKKYFAAYANYFLKYLQAYGEAGVPVKAVTIQNEVDTNQDGGMPACQWGQEYEVEFAGKHLGPRLKAAGMSTKIWIIDHNYNLWGRAIASLDDPDANPYIDGIAWHGYLGEPVEMTRVHNTHPDKHAYWTEGGPTYTDPKYATDWATWGTTFAGVLRNWARCIVGWNLALDEHGKPNIGPFDCGGLVTVNSQTKEVTRSGQYWAFRHYTAAAKRGAYRVSSEGEMPGLSHVAFRNADGSMSMVITNPGAAMPVTIQMGNAQTEYHAPDDSITTLTWRS